MSKRDSLPPHDKDAEMALVGCVLIAGSDSEMAWTLDEVVAIASPQMLFFPDHATIYNAALAVAKAGDPLDLVSVSERLRADGREDLYATAIELAESVPSVTSAPFYARQVRKCWQRREVIRLAQKAANAAYDLNVEPCNIIADTCAKLDAIDAVSAIDREPVAEADLLYSMANPADHADQKVPLALGEGGRILGGGFDYGSLTIVGGRPSTGKTSFGLTLCVNASRVTEGCASLFVSVEMTAGQVALRLFSMRAAVGMQALRAGAFTGRLTWKRGQALPCRPRTRTRRRNP